MGAKQLQEAFRVEYLKGIACRLAQMTPAEREAFMRWFNARPR